MGYFSVTRIIHHFSFKDVQDDLNYICETYFPKSKPPRGTVPTSTRTHLSIKTLDLFGYKIFQTSHESLLLEKLNDVATISCDARFILDECLIYLGQERLSIPKYSRLQKIVTGVLSPFGWFPRGTPKYEDVILLNTNLSRDVELIRDEKLALETRLMNDLSDERGKVGELEARQLASSQRIIELEEANKQLEASKVNDDIREQLQQMSLSLKAIEDRKKK